VLPGPRGGTYYNAPQRAWQRIRARAGLADIRVHDLRHGFASVLAGLGESLPIIGKTLGHRQAAKPPSLRWAPAMRRRDGTDGPAMIGRIDSIDGELIGIARTWLARDAAGNWHRLDRAMLGRATGGAVRLARAAETLLIGEGIETLVERTFSVQAAAVDGTAALGSVVTSGTEPSHISAVVSV
jgi:hypothetical protein